MVPIIQANAMLPTDAWIWSGVGVFGMDANQTPPNDAVFVDGVQVNASGGACGGLGDPSLPTKTHNVTLCQALNFNAGAGNLLAFSSELPMLNALTLPAILTILGLPFRTYLLGLIAPAVGVVIMTHATSLETDVVANVANNHTKAYTSRAVSSSHFAMFFVFFAVVVYAGCIFSTFANERYSRSLFTIHLSLSKQRDSLLTERDHLRCARRVVVDDVGSGSAATKDGQTDRLGETLTRRTFLLCCGRRRRQADRRRGEGETLTRDGVRSLSNHRRPQLDHLPHYHGMAGHS